MKKVNDSTRIGSDAKTRSYTKDVASSEEGVGADAGASIGFDGQAEGAVVETAKPKVAKKSSRPRVKSEGKTAVKKEKSSSRSSRRADAAFMTETSPPIETVAGYEERSDESVASASRYRPVGQSGDRIAIFIDGSNLFYAASHLNIEVDYRRLLSTLVGDRRLLRAYFYTGVDPQNEKQRGFLLWLNRHGHRVVSKELMQMPDGSRKANMHVEMAVDMMRIASHCPTITLLGGDGNLAYALESLSRDGISIEVVSLQSMTSDSLIDLADSYVDLADLRDEIKR